MYLAICKNTRDSSGVSLFILSLEFFSPAFQAAYRFNVERPVSRTSYLRFRDMTQVQELFVSANAFNMADAPVKDAMFHGIAVFLVVMNDREGAARSMLPGRIF